MRQPPPPAPPRPADHDRRTRRIAWAVICTIIALPIAGMAAVLASQSPLESAAYSLDSCRVNWTEEGRLAWIMAWSEPLCMVESWDALERFGFDRADLQRSLEEGQAVQRGGYTVRAVQVRATDPDLQVTVLAVP